MTFTCPHAVVPANYGLNPEIEAESLAEAQEKLCGRCPAPKDKCKGLEAEEQVVKITPGQLGLFEEG